jgi:hypothetical protein
METSPGMDATNGEFVAYGSLPTGHVVFYDTFYNTTSDTGLQIQNQSSPSMGPLYDPATGLVNDWMITFSVVGGYLYTYDTSSGTSVNLGPDVEPFTSPAFTTGARLLVE